MANSRRKSTKLNMIAGLVQEFVAIVCGLILPRIILSQFGSQYNGIVNSITQFLGFSVILRSGLGAVTNAALYKPLAMKDMEKVSGIMVATANFMRKVGWILIVMIIGFATVYPFLVIDEFSYFFSFSLILIIGVATFVENMFSIKYKILLQADQKYYVQTICAVIAQILSTILGIILIVSGTNIHIARLGMVIGLMSTPLMLKFYVRKKYNINWKAAEDKVAIKSRWDAFAQQLATIVNNNVDTVIMTVLFAMTEISVYSVYYMVVHNVTKLMQSCLNGIKSTFGDMLAKGEIKQLQQRFKDTEWMIFTGTTIIFTVTAVMLTPFVMVYTSGITDVDYNRYWFGIAMIAGAMMNVLRIPYQLVVEAAGHFKQTRNGAFLEVILNVVISVVLAYFFGVIGLMGGTFVAGLVRTAQFVWYSYRKILHLSLKNVLKKYIISICTCIGLIGLFYAFFDIECSDYFEWSLWVVFVCCIVAVIIILVNILFGYKNFISVYQYLFKRRKKN